MYEFSMSAFFLGLVVLAVGGVMTVFYKQIADNLGGGLSSYERYKLAGLICCGVGIILMTGLQSIPLNWLVDTIFNR